MCHYIYYTAEDKIFRVKILFAFLFQAFNHVDLFQLPGGKCKRHSICHGNEYCADKHCFYGKYS